MRIKKGFTLMELLMCVLIIGVLTAVAAPKYTKILERSRATEAMSMIKSINDAVYAYAAGRTNGECPTSFRQLSITLPVQNDNVGTIRLKNFRYELGKALLAHIPGTKCPGALATRINGGSSYDYVIWNPYRVRNGENGRGRLGCYSPKKKEKSIELCASLGLYEPGAIPTPAVELGDPEETKPIGGEESGPIIEIGGGKRK